MLSESNGFRLINYYSSQEHRELQFLDDASDIAKGETAKDAS